MEKMSYPNNSKDIITPDSFGVIYPLLDFSRESIIKKINENLLSLTLKSTSVGGGELSVRERSIFSGMTKKQKVELLVELFFKLVSKEKQKQIMKSSVKLVTALNNKVRQLRAQKDKNVRSFASKEIARTLGKGFFSLGALYPCSANYLLFSIKKIKKDCFFYTECTILKEVFCEDNEKAFKMVVDFCIKTFHSGEEKTKNIDDEIILIKKELDSIY